MTLSEWRKGAGKTQSAVALALEVHVLTVSSWERGAKKPSTEKMEQIATMTGGAVQPNDFYPSALQQLKTAA